ncbi:MAG: ORC1-type DNA replication protein [Candidatus Hodarchaeaceae archaeon]|nr:ORC1-type DNA replication protein [Candidatus Hodarchaeaceae archaeon]
MSSEGLFGMLLETRPIFKNREYLRPSYTPEELPHRDEQIHQLARILAAPLRGETPSNIFIYGKTGTGKTASVKYVAKELERVSDRAPLKVEVIYLNCEVVNTQYRILATLSDTFLKKLKNGRGKEYLNSLGLPERVPMTGWPTDEVYRSFFVALDQERQLAVIILDEIDKLVQKSGDEVLYNLTRMNSDLKNAKVTIVGISNDTNFMEYLDPRVRSSLSEEELVFPTYNGLQLKDILEKRAEISFVEGALGNGVIQLCAAHAAREHGDARRALDLLRVSGELAERMGADVVTVDHVRYAYEKIEQDSMVEVIKTLPTQSKLVLYSIVLLMERTPRRVVSGEVYGLYQELCRHNGLEMLTQRRVSDLVSELDMLGIISARIVNKGRYGRTKEIKLNIHPTQARAAMQGDYYISAIDVLALPRQLTLA